MQIFIICLSAFLIGAYICRPSKKEEPILAYCEINTEKGKVHEFIYKGKSYYFRDADQCEKYECKADLQD